MLLADDHPVFLAGLRSMLGAIPNAEVVGEATTGQGAVAAARRLSPDLVLMDVDLPGINGIEATQKIVAEGTGTAVLVLSMLDDLATILAAMRAGARGYLLKGAGLHDVARAIEAVSKGDAIFGPSVASAVLQHLSQPTGPSVPFSELTDRERAVLEHVADGRNNTEIARNLGLSVKTVRNYLSRIFAKLQVTDRTEAAVRARRGGLGH